MREVYKLLLELLVGKLVGHVEVLCLSLNLLSFLQVLLASARSHLEATVFFIRAFDLLWPMDPLSV